MFTVAHETPDQCSTPLQISMTLYLNIFRGEPAISRFDWHITPNHNSSEHLAAYNGADLHFVLPKFHPGHG
jgi:hypothetical protein